MEIAQTAPNPAVERLRRIIDARFDDAESADVLLTVGRKNGRDTIRAKLSEDAATRFLAAVEELLD